MDDFSLQTLRYGLAVILLVLLPVVCAFWFVIHGAIGFWKTRPAWMAYWAALIVILATLGLIWAMLPMLLGADLGSFPGLTGAGAAIYLTSWALSRSIRKHLTFRTFAGLPEVRNETTTLIETGPFSVVRHPRYFMILVGVLGWSLAANYIGGYVVSVVFAFCLLLIIRIEERELCARFGDAYRAYQARVPALLPAPRNLGKLFV
jgi:protein-S-isoprenylcysteine O-methyltransferase Ste14